MRQLSFRARLFVAALVAAGLGLIVAGVVFAQVMRRELDLRIERTLVAEARSVAELLSRGAPAAMPDEQNEAGRLGALLGARVTLIAPDGRVLGDSAETEATLPAM